MKSFIYRILITLALGGLGCFFIWITKIAPARKVAVSIEQTKYLYERVKDYHKDYGEFPKEGLRALPAALLGKNLEELDYLEKFSKGQKKVKKEEVRDVYGAPYSFRVVDGGIRVISAGRNGKLGDEDDVDEHSYLRALAGMSPFRVDNLEDDGVVRSNPVGKIELEY